MNWIVIITNSQFAGSTRTSHSCDVHNAHAHVCYAHTQKYTHKIHIWIKNKPRNIWLRPSQYMGWGFEIGVLVLPTYRHLLICAITKAKMWGYSTPDNIKFVILSNLRTKYLHFRLYFSYILCIRRFVIILLFFHSFSFFPQFPVGPIFNLIEPHQPPNHPPPTATAFTVQSLACTATTIYSGALCNVGRNGRPKRTRACALWMIFDWPRNTN